MITLQRIQKSIFSRIDRSLKVVWRAASSKRGRECSVCGERFPAFFSYGACKSWGCPVCGSSPRERFVCTLIDQGVLALSPNARVLHIAPSEQGLIERFRRAAEYVPADLHPDRYPGVPVVKLDLSAMTNVGQFDLVYASHVLEHVPDDRLAMSNIFEHLRPGGQAWFLVPLHRFPTVDGDVSMSPFQRERLFGQWDHVRQYGLDIADRLEAAGFSVSQILPSDLGSSVSDRFGLDQSDVVFRSRRPPLSASMQEAN